MQQNESEASYMPQRKPEDGEIDWGRTPEEIYNFVRAQTKPYPGAFSYLGNSEIRVWKARPFSFDYHCESTRPGDVIGNFSNDDFLVRSGRGYVLVSDYSVSSECEEESPVKGKKLGSADFNEQLRNIVERHKRKYPDLPVSRDITDLI